MNKPVFLPLTTYTEYPPEKMKQRATDLANDLCRRRTVREYSNQPVPREVIQDCLRAAISAPSGANMQPWHFVAISDDQTKRQIRIEAEKEEKHFYEHRASQEWLDALEPLGTNERKPFLESAPWLIAVFQQRWGFLPDGANLGQDSHQVAILHQSATNPVSAHDPARPVAHHPVSAVLQRAACAMEGRKRLLLRS